MKALILVGGYGTRLRPLTLSIPKPLLPFCNKSILEHQVEALVKAGVDHVILAVAYQPDAMREAIKLLEQKFGIRISSSLEDEPLGTAGPIRLAKDLLMEGNPDDPFFVCNSDVICEFPLTDMLTFHGSHGGEGTILVTEVSNPSQFGVVVADEQTGRIERFVEKPTEFVGDQINAGLYIFNKSIIDKIELKPTSIEKEIFPQMAADKILFKFKLNGYWADVGQPKDFLHGMRLYLSHLSSKGEEPQMLRKEENILGNVLIHPSAVLGQGCLIGPDVTIGEGCEIGDGVRLSSTAVFNGVKIASHSKIDGSIIAKRSRIGRWVRIEGLTMIGEDVSIADECLINGAKILQHQVIKESIFEPGKIIM